MRPVALLLLAGLVAGCAKQKPPALPTVDEEDLGEPGGSDEDDPDDESGLEDDDDGDDPGEEEDAGPEDDDGDDPGEEEDPE